MNYTDARKRQEKPVPEKADGCRDLVGSTINKGSPLGDNKWQLIGSVNWRGRMGERGRENE